MNTLRRSCRFIFGLYCLLIVGGADQVAAEESAGALHQRIDAIVARRLATLKIVPAEASEDAEFARRVYLDLTGAIPTVGEAREFLDDESGDKRQQLIDNLLSSPAYALHMARVFDVMLVERRVPTISSYDVPATTWRTYLAAALAENRPWDQIVHEILASDGTDEQHAAAVKFYLVRDVAPHQLTRDVGRLLLGIDLQCAQCHDDPRIDAYRQLDYFGIYAFLQRLTPFRDSQKNVSLVGEKAAGETKFVSVFTAQTGETSPRLPGGEMVPDPDVEKGKEYIVPPGPKERGVPTYSRRGNLAELLPRPETPGFSRNITNRLWAQLMGRGIVHPLDLHHPDNPPSHPELLVELERWLVEHHYDIKGLLREIALSQTYQRTSILPAGVQDLPDDAYAVAPLRGLTADQLSWSILQATGRIEQHFDALAAKRNAAAESQDAEPAWKRRFTELAPLERQAQKMAAVFVGLPGQADGDFEPVVDQALHLLNSPTMLPLLQNEPSTLLKRLMACAEPEPLADELYLSVLSRRPEAEEVALVRGVLETTGMSAERNELLTGLIWGLLLSSEFRLNH